MTKLVVAGISFLIFVVVAMVIPGLEPSDGIGAESHCKEGEVRPCTPQPGDTQEEIDKSCPEYDVSRIELLILQFTNEERAKGWISFR